MQLDIIWCLGINVIVLYSHCNTIGIDPKFEDLSLTLSFTLF